MYGLVNQAIQDLVTRQFGEAKWEEIKAKAGVDVDVFLSMDAYPDEVTYDLIGAASSLLHSPPEVLLEEFGKYWTLYTAREGYGQMLQLGGSSFVEFMRNLHNLHTHVALSFPHLTPPSFWCSDVGPDSMRLHYQSTRAGLAPMVVGLVKGLGEMFHTDVAIKLVRDRSRGADHDEFDVRFQPRP